MTEIGAIVLAIALLNPLRAYFQPGHPVEIKLDQAATKALLIQLKAAPDAKLSLLLVSSDGGVRAVAALDASKETFDLAALFPGGGDTKAPAVSLWNGQTHYVQLAMGPELKPIGSPLVVVPLSPPNLATPRAPDALRIDVEKRVVFHTTAGVITMAMDPEAAPNTVMHFVRLVQDGFYTNIKFHRIVPGFVVQAGDPTGTGTGGPGYLLDLEPSRKEHQAGTLSMARQGHDVNTAGSQFFICLARESCAPLDGQYTAFGQVVEGWPVVQKIAESKLADAQSGKPVQPPVILRSELIAAPPRVPIKNR